jgi:galactose mutarotase-like enzyme
LFFLLVYKKSNLNSMFTISNQQITACFNAEGAELCSLQANENKQELIWQADAAFWGRHAPILFPIVGKLWQDEYRVEGKTFNLPQHGFARDTTFKLEKLESHKATFTIQWNEETLAKYPFKFLLRVIYEVIKNTLQITYQVENQDDKAILFSIGAHPAFNCPVLPSEKRSDYMLDFAQSEEAKRNRDEIFDSRIREYRS